MSAHCRRFALDLSNHKPSQHFKYPNSFYHTHYYYSSYAIEADELSLRVSS